MDKSLLNQVLHEYEIKRNKAILDAAKRKKEITQINPHLSQIEDEIANISIQTSKALLLSKKNEREKLLNELKKETKVLIKEKNTFLKSLSKDSRFS